MKIEHEGQEVEVTTKRDGAAIWNRVTFTAKAVNRIENVYELQKKVGYHPMGYDGPWAVSREDGVTTWQCSASCD